LSFLEQLVQLPLLQQLVSLVLSHALESENFLRWQKRVLLLVLVVGFLLFGRHLNWVSIFVAGVPVAAPPATRLLLQARIESIWLFFAFLEKAQVDIEDFLDVRILRLLVGLLVQFAKEFLSVRPDLSRAASSNSLFDPIPVLSIQTQRVQECLVFLRCPTPL